ncbi:MAG: family 20 glycosylhydrolase [Prolixibacteraceae bacterium]
MGNNFKIHHIVEKNVTNVALVLIGYILFSFGTANQAKAQSIIPKPQRLIQTSGTFKLNSQTKLYTNLKGPEKKLMDSYLTSLPYQFAVGKANEKSDVIRLLIGKLADTEDREAYCLKVTPEVVEIRANTGAGLFYGIQTMFQLGEGVNGLTLNIPCSEVKDEPRFSYRGYELDVSRHFFPKEFILQMLDALAYYKINKFHFHLFDTGGWRIQMKKYPALTEQTAYRTKEDLGDWWGDKNRFCTKDKEGAYGGFYTQDDIREIIAYASARQIEIIPEFDVPGHSRDVLWVYPELACEGTDPRATNSNELCIGNEKTFRFCEDILLELMELFPSNYIHIGGDEANREIWSKCPLCQKRMSEEHIINVADWQNYFTNRIEKFLASHGKSIIGWDEILDGNVSKNAIVMSWREEVSSGSDAIKRGHQVIMSPTSHCYLDYYQDCPYLEPKALLGYTPLKQTYSFEPIPAGTTDKSLVLGVQGNLWTEHISTIEHAEYMTFPRILAIAEVGWTQPELKSFDDFKNRTFIALEYLKNKGFHTFNLRSEFGSRQASLTPVNNLAKGRTVIYLTPYSSSFSGSNETTLTDGWLGNWNANGDRWQGFGGNMDVLIDMEQLTDINAVQASFIFVPTAGEFLPDSIEISASDDGKNFKTLYKKKIISDNTVHFDICNYGWAGKVRARYIRYQALKPINWGDILCDEIIIK